MLGKLSLDVLERARTDSLARAAEEDGVGYFLAERPLLLGDKLDRPRGLLGVQLRALRWDNHQIGPAHGVSYCHGGRALKINNHERRLHGRCFNGLNDRVFRHVGQNSQVRGHVRQLRPIGNRLVGIGINDGNGRTTAHELSSDDNGCGGLPCPAFWRDQSDDWHAVIPIRYGKAFRKLF